MLQPSASTYLIAWKIIHVKSFLKSTSSSVSRWPSSHITFRYRAMCHDTVVSPFLSENEEDSKTWRHSIIFRLPSSSQHKKYLFQSVIFKKTKAPFWFPIVIVANHWLGENTRLENYSVWYFGILGTHVIWCG